MSTKTGEPNIKQAITTFFKLFYQFLDAMNTTFPEYPQFLQYKRQIQKLRFNKTSYNHIDTKIIESFLKNMDPIIPQISIMDPCTLTNTPENQKAPIYIVPKVNFLDIVSVNMSDQIRDTILTFLYHLLSIAAIVCHREDIIGMLKTNAMSPRVCALIQGAQEANSANMFDQLFGDDEASKLLKHTLKKYGKDFSAQDILSLMNGGNDKINRIISEFERKSQSKNITEEDMQKMAMGIFDRMKHSFPGLEGLDINTIQNNPDAPIGNTGITSRQINDIIEKSPDGQINIGAITKQLMGGMFAGHPELQNLDVEAALEMMQKYQAGDATPTDYKSSLDKMFPKTQ